MFRCWAWKSYSFVLFIKQFTTRGGRTMKLRSFA